MRDAALRLSWLSSLRIRLMSRRSFSCYCLWRAFWRTFPALYTRRVRTIIFSIQRPVSYYVKFLMGCLEQLASGFGFDRWECPLGSDDCRSISSMELRVNWTLFLTRALRRVASSSIDICKMETLRRKHYRCVALLHVRY